MSKRANPTLIGAFVLGAIVIGFSGVLYFGSIKFKDTSIELAAYFDESVSGLESGSLVKYRGVTIGQVKKIMIRTKYQKSIYTHIPVILKIDNALITNLGVEGFDMSDPIQLKQQVDDGLRAQLQLESLITGLYYIELAYHEFPRGERVQEIQEPNDEYGEIPTIASPFAAIGKSATEILAKIGEFNIKTFNYEVIKLIRKSNEKLEALDVEAINSSLTNTLSAITKRVESKEIDQILKDVSLALNDTRSAISKIDKNIDGFFGEFGSTNQEAREALQAAKDALAKLGNAGDSATALMTPDSSIRYKLEQTLSDISNAAKALQLFIDYLERNPKSLITGKKHGGNN